MTHTIRRHRPSLAFAVALTILAICGRSPAAELGDLNGDGRVSPADAYQFHRWLWTGLDVYRPAEGSGGFAAAFPCTREFRGAEWHLLFMEALRRASDHPLPHFFERWPGDPGGNAPPPPADPSVRIEVLPTVHSSGAPDVELRVRVTSSFPLGFLSLILEADGLDLRPRYPPAVEYGQMFTAATSTEYYLVTGGLLPFVSHPRLEFDPGPDGTVLSLPASLPKGTQPGTHRVALRPGTEVVTTFGDAIVPELVDAEIRIDRTVATGLAQAFPPLALVDEAGERRIGGEVGLRVAPAEAAPGDEVSMRVQLRTERPLNDLRFQLTFDPTALKVLAVTPLYVDPEHGRVRPEDHYLTKGNGSAARELPGEVNCTYAPTIDGTVWKWTWMPYTFYNYANLKWIEPLGEWIDFLEVRLSVLDRARERNEVWLAFADWETDVDDIYYSSHEAAYRPYVTRAQQSDLARGCGETAAFWSVEPIELQSSAIRIIGGGQEPVEPDYPVDPVQADLRVLVGESYGDGTPDPAEGQPGDLVSLPVTFRSRVPLWQARLVLGYDDSLVDFEGFEVYMVDFDGRPYTKTISPAGGNGYAENTFCEWTSGAGRECIPGLIPFEAMLRGDLWVPPDIIPEETIIVDIRTVFGHAFASRGGLPSWETEEWHLLGRALFRIHEDAPEATTPVPGAEAAWKPGPWPSFIRSRTSGYPTYDLTNPPLRYDFPAVDVREGLIRIVRGVPFLRGDSNDDGNFDLSDAINTLNALFMGSGSTPCADAADANDDGGLDIADAIFTLGHLFLGGPEPPWPFPEPGPDPTDDDLRCERPGEAAR